MTDRPIAVSAANTQPRKKSSGYPAPFADRVADRVKRPLGDQFGLTNFGVNLTTLKPGSESALLHRHKTQDEFIYILEGRPTLVTDQGEVQLAPGMCAGFPANGIAHHLVNRTQNDVTYIEIGDRSPNDEGTYPNDDLKAVQSPDGKWQFTRKDGTPY
ncbi:MAG: cupin domain-containing protein [Pseudomonadota bacterium]